MTEQEGLFTIPTRLYLDAGQRAKLDHLLRSEPIELGDLVTRVLAAYLEQMPEPAPAAETGANESSELRARRVNLARLRAQRDAGGGAGAAWLNGYIAELEAEIQQLEQHT